MNGKGQFTIQLDVIGQNLQELLATQKGMAAVKQEAQEMQSLFKMGLGIDLAGRFNSAVASLPGIFQRAVDRGVQFNGTLQQAQLGIAAVLKQFDRTGSIKNFDDAMRQSGAAIETLKEKAKQSPATFEQLVQSFQAVSGPALAAGISVGRTVDLIVNMSQALSGLGIQSSQILQETRALLTGNINADAAAAKILNITSADITRAKEQGQLYEFLTGKIAAFAEAGQRGAGTLTTAMSNLDDAITDLLAKATRPIFEELTQGALSINEALSDPAAVESLKAIGHQIASLVRAGADLTEFAVRNADVLMLLAQAAATVGLVFTALKLRDLIVLIGSKTAAWLASRMAVEAESAALARNTAALQANAAARGAAAASGAGAGALGGAAGTLGIGLAVLAVGAQLISAIEARALSRLEAEDATAAALAKQDRSLVQQIATAKTLDDLAKHRAQMVEELSTIDREQVGITQAMFEDKAPGSSERYQNELAALERRKRLLEQGVRTIDNRGPEIVAKNQADAAASEAVAKQEAAFAKAQQVVEKLTDKVAAARREFELLQKSAPGQLAQLQQELAKIDADTIKRSTEAAAGPDQDKAKTVIEAIRLQADEKRLPILAAISELEKQIADDKLRANDAAKKAVDDAEKEAKAAREKADALLSGRNALALAQLDTKIARIDANPFATSEEKRQERAPVLRQKDAQLSVEATDLGSRLKAGVADDEQRLELQRRLNDVLREQVMVQAELATGTAWGQMQAEFTAYVDSLGTDAGRLVGVFTEVGESIRTSLGDAFAQAILAGGTFEERAVGFAQSVGTAFINSAAQFVADWIYSHLLMDNIRRIFNIKRVTEETVTQGALTGITAAGETARTTATVTGSTARSAVAAKESMPWLIQAGIKAMSAVANIPYVGPFLAIAAMGAVIAAGAKLLKGGFAEGGLVSGPGSGTSDSIVTRLSNGEFVIKQAAVSRYGADTFEAFNNMEIGSAPIAAGSAVSAPAVSPSAAGGGGSSVRVPNVQVIVIPDEREATRIARHSEARGDIVRIVKEERATIFGA